MDIADRAVEAILTKARQLDGFGAPLVGGTRIQTTAHIGAMGVGETVVEGVIDPARFQFAADSLRSLAGQRDKPQAGRQGATQDTKRSPPMGRLEHWGASLLAQ